MTRFRSSRAAKKTSRRGGGYAPTHVAGYKLMKCHCPTESLMGGGAIPIPPGHKMKRCLVPAPSEKHIYGGGAIPVWNIPRFWKFAYCICPEGNRGGGVATSMAIPGYELKECLCPVERSGMGALSKRGRKTKKGKKRKSKH